MSIVTLPPGWRVTQDGGDGLPLLVIEAAPVTEALIEMIDIYYRSAPYALPARCQVNNLAIIRPGDTIAMLSQLQCGWP